MNTMSGSIKAGVRSSLERSTSLASKAQKVDSVIRNLRIVAIHTLSDVYERARSWLEGHQHGVASEIEVQRPRDNTTTLDSDLTWVVHRSLHKYLQQVSNRLEVAFESKFEIEEQLIQLQIEPGEASEPAVKLEAHGDPLAGSKNLTRQIEGVVNKRVYSFPFGPNSMSLLAFKLPRLCGQHYVAGAAVDLGYATMYSGTRLWSGSYESFIGDLSVVPESFNLGKARSPRVLLLSFMNMDGNQDFYDQVRRSIEQTVKGAEVHVGGVPCASWNLTRLVNATYDAVVDVRTLSPQRIRYLEPIDCAGLIPFLLGTGCFLANEQGQAVSGFECGRRPICLLASYSQDLIDKLVRVVRPIGLQTGGAWKK